MRQRDLMKKPLSSLILASIFQIGLIPIAFGHTDEALPPKKDPFSNEFCRAVFDSQSESQDNPRIHRSVSYQDWVSQFERVVSTKQNGEELPNRHLRFVPQAHRGEPAWVTHHLGVSLPSPFSKSFTKFIPFIKQFKDYQEFWTQFTYFKEEHAIQKEHDLRYHYLIPPHWRFDFSNLYEEVEVEIDLLSNSQARVRWLFWPTGSEEATEVQTIGSIEYNKNHSSEYVCFKIQIKTDPLKEWFTWLETILNSDPLFFPVSAHHYSRDKSQAQFENLIQAFSEGLEPSLRAHIPTRKKLYAFTNAHRETYMDSKSLYLEVSSTRLWVYHLDYSVDSSILFYPAN